MGLVTTEIEGGWRVDDGDRHLGTARLDDTWECELCGATGEAAGRVAGALQLAMHHGNEHRPSEQ